MTYYLGATPEAAVKSTTIFFYGHNSAPAQELAAAERKALRIGITRDAATFDGPEPCDAVVVMPDVPVWQRERIAAAYGEKVQAKASEPEPVRRSYPNAHPAIQSYELQAQDSAGTKTKLDPVDPPRQNRASKMRNL